MIENTSGKQIKNIISLINKSKNRNEQKLFVAEGVRILSEAPAKSIEKIYVSEKFLKEYNKEEYYYKINDIMNEKGYELVSDKVFSQLSQTKTPQGVLAVLKMPEYEEEYSSLMGDNVESASIVFLDDVRDPGNLGTIIRTAEAAGISMLIMSRECVDIYNPKVIRATMGAVYRLPFRYVEKLSSEIDRWKEKGYKIYAAHLDGELDYAKMEYNDKTGIIIGNEANGICEEVKSRATDLIKIPMEGNAESLNAAVAAAVLMYEVYRQRRMK